LGISVRNSASSLDAMWSRVVRHDYPSLSPSLQKTKSASTQGVSNRRHIQRNRHHRQPNIVIINPENIVIIRRIRDRAPSASSIKPLLNKDIIVLH